MSALGQKQTSRAQSSCPLYPQKRTFAVQGAIGYAPRYRFSEGLQLASAKMQTLDRCQRLPFGCAVCSLAQKRSMTP
jgi:hypothetical protein